MKFGIALLVFCLVFSGCGFVTKTVQVPQPYPVYCEVEEPPKPVLPVDGLSSETTNLFEISRALWATIELLEVHLERLSVLVKACKKPS